VELGTHTGNSYFSFCQSILENKTLTRAYAVDTWEGDSQAGFYDESVFSNVERTNLQYGSFSKLLRMKFDEAANQFDNKSVDLLHIDGLHTYDAVKKDFETWLPKMSSHGVVLFHDTNVHLENFGVHRLWEELTKNYKTLEFFHSNGLGILDLSPQPSHLIPDDIGKQLELREIFATLSEQILTRFERDALQAERDMLLASGSWRITKPIRGMKRIMQGKNRKI
jgi:hypothetical protein